MSATKLAGDFRTNTSHSRKYTLPNITSQPSNQNGVPRGRKRKLYQVDLRNARRPYYNLMMFPYPSAEGLHVGNMFAFVGSDVHGRWKAMQGFDVFEPIGLDAFGIHSENFAIKKGIHPRILTAQNAEAFSREAIEAHWEPLRLVARTEYN